MNDVGERIGDLLQGSMITFFGLILGNGLGLVAEALIARSLSPAVYGSLALAYTAVVLTSRLSNLGIRDGVVRLISSSSLPSEKMRVAQHGFLIVTVASLLFITFLYFSRNIIANVFDDPQIPAYIIMLSPVVLLFPYRGISIGLLRSEGRSTGAVISRDILGPTISIVLLTVAVITGYPVYGGIVYWISLPLVIAISSLIIIRNSYSLTGFLRITPDQAIITRLLRFSLPLALAAYITVFLSYLDIIMIGYFLDSTQVGYYRAIQPLRRAPIFVMIAFQFLFLPLATELYEKDEITKLGEFYKTSTKWIVVITLPIVLVLSIFSKDVVRLLYGTDYLPAATALSVLVIGLYFRAFVGLNGDMVKAIDRTNIEMISAAAGVLGNFLLNLLLIPRYGIVGAAIATSGGFFIYNIIELYGIYRIIKIHPFGLNNIKPILPVTLVALGIQLFITNGRLGFIELGIVGVTLSLLSIVFVPLTRSLSHTDLVFVERIESYLGINLELIKQYVR